MQCLFVVALAYLTPFTGNCEPYIQNCFISSSKLGVKDDFSLGVSSLELGPSLSIQSHL